MFDWLLIRTLSRCCQQNWDHL
ncbi:rCG55792, partial [Rattus norvegicus]